MTVQDHTGATPEGASGGDESRSGRMETAKTEASNVASTAAEGARDVASETSAQAKAVASDAKQQLDRLISQSRDEVRQQAEQRSTQAAGQLRTLSEQFSALVEGRPQEAGPLVGYASDVQRQLRSWASRVEQGGPQGVIDDVTQFARRRPGVFLAGAVGMGFVVGRLVRATASNQGDDGAPTLADTPEAPAFGQPSPLPPPMSSPGPVS
jgi:vacuolar-type H+-ATPase subunit H